MARRSKQLSTGRVAHIELLREKISSFDEYPFSIPAVRQLTRLELHPKVTFFVGENGSGKSTLVEALAVALGINPEGGTRNFGFSTRESHSPLHRYLRVARTGAIRDAFFLRAESIFNVATEIERLDAEPIPFALPVIDSYGGVYLHDRSHGESFLAIAENRLGRRGFYLMDEPESALSASRQLTLMGLIHEWVNRGGCQVVIATHSPLLLAYPDSLIYELDQEGIHAVSYEATSTVRIYREFLSSPKCIDPDAIRRGWIARSGNLNICAHRVYEHGPDGGPLDPECLDTVSQGYWRQDFLGETLDFETRADAGPRGDRVTECP